MSRALTGLWVPVVTPFTKTLAIDHSRLVEHARRVVDVGARGIVLFGTTGEAPSLAVDERREALDALVAAGFEPASIVVGTGCPALPDTVALTRHAAAHDVAGVLVVPPYYYKGVSDEGVIAAFTFVVERSGTAVPPLLLYHFPRLSGVPITPAVVVELRARFGATIAGIKDSGGEASHTRSLCERFPELAVFPGNESALDEALAAGAAGCITATANVAAAPIARFIAEHAAGRAGEAGALFAEIVARRRELEKYPMIATLKAILAARSGVSDWSRVRPPLVAADPPSLVAFGG